MLNGLETVLAGLRGEARRNEPMARHTSLKVGGPVALYLEPADLADLQNALAVLRKEQIPYFVVGGGYNLLVRDGGFRGCAISLKRLDQLLLLPGQRLEVGAGVSNARLCKTAAESALSGIEFLVGIPGSFGGALTMNAGAHGGETLKRVESLVTVRSGKVLSRTSDELDFGYRHLTLEPGEVVVAATLQLAEGERSSVETTMKDFLAHRGGAQKVGFPNAGSFFKNPPRQQAWQLIDQAGLRGYQVGGAQVSEVHTNFLVNRGGASAGDFLKLAALIKEKVLAVSGAELQEEVRIVGED
ncbi:UDP-N-acetylenolpyruvoylglucosamine reductase [Geomonas limicola]|uniref:UDP-N-acetylenolpyruvoylglucosamine reductase n=1 Tax=Geomonas limicola TaxID=2740186 RepID=A0A6V8NBI5_9BACT|nr:UDP-N-acetylmuramate dehydrogenase [Geomonas limicola]GFO68903.1 UDP-N-acetylenolpyruvoylglucosamine reductase [Geomonas limicola]